jgi:hypothetical protein
MTRGEAHLADRPAGPGEAFVIEPEPDTPEPPAGDAHMLATEADPLASGAERWTNASEAVQTTAKWVITALAAVGAVMFAKGFITTPQLSIEDNLPQLLIAWALGVAAVIGVDLLIWGTSRALFPQVLTLGSLPAKFRELVDLDPADYLPSGATSVEQFEQRLGETAKPPCWSRNLSARPRRKRRRLKVLTIRSSYGRPKDSWPRCEQKRRPSSPTATSTWPSGKNS